MAMPRPAKSASQIVFTSCTGEKEVHESEISVPAAFLGGDACGGLSKELAMLLPFSITSESEVCQIPFSQAGHPNPYLLPSRMRFSFQAIELSVVMAIF